MNQIATWPLVLRHRMSALPSPSKSPLPWICQLKSGAPGTLSPTIDEPSISQTATSPWGPRHKMSLRPVQLQTSPWPLQEFVVDDLHMKDLSQANTEPVV